MKIGIGITMFNEHSVVLQTIKNIIKCKDFVPYIVVAHSDDENLSTELEEIKKLADETLNMMEKFNSAYKGMNFDNLEGRDLRKAREKYNAAKRDIGVLERGTSIEAL